MKRYIKGIQMRQVSFYMLQYSNVNLKPNPSKSPGSSFFIGQ